MPSKSFGFILWTCTVIMKLSQTGGPLSAGCQTAAQSITEHQIGETLNSGSESKLVCFYTFDKNFETSHLENLCTHIIVGFFGIIKETYVVENSTEKLQMLREITSLKYKNTKLNVLISVGGAQFNEFSYLVKTHIGRKMFIKSVIELLKYSNTDGIDLDWEWPAINGNAKEKIQFIQLLYEFRQELNKHKKKYLMSVDVSPSRQIIELSYKVQYLAQYVDFVNVMCYDYHFFSKWYPFTGHNAPLYSSSNDIMNLNINSTIYYWISNSMPKEKIVLGIPTYGHSYRLSSREKYSVGAPASDFGTFGKNGFTTYPDTCQFITSANATVVFDNYSQVPYAYKFPNWVSFDNEQSLILKASYAQEQKLSGVMVFSVNSDDTSGVCNGHGLVFPLLRAVRTIIFNEV